MSAVTLDLARTRFALPLDLLASTAVTRWLFPNFDTATPPKSLTLNLYLAAAPKELKRVTP